MHLKLKVGKVVSTIDIESIDAVFEDVGKIVSKTEGYVPSTVVFVHKGKRYRLSSISEARTRLKDAGTCTHGCGILFRRLRGRASIINLACSLRSGFQHVASSGEGFSCCSLQTMCTSIHPTLQSWERVSTSAVAAVQWCACHNSQPVLSRWLHLPTSLHSTACAKAAVMSLDCRAGVSALFLPFRLQSACCEGSAWFVHDLTGLHPQPNLSDSTEPQMLLQEPRKQTLILLQV